MAALVVTWRWAEGEERAARLTDVKPPRLAGTPGGPSAVRSVATVSAFVAIKALIGVALLVNRGAAVACGQRVIGVVEPHPTLRGQVRTARVHPRRAVRWSFCARLPG